jgi:hypothetical protein
MHACLASCFRPKPRKLLFRNLGVHTKDEWYCEEVRKISTLRDNDVLTITADCHEG